VPRFSHVVLLVLENESSATTWSSGSVAAYLNGLPSKGALADQYYATGHHSLDNFIAMVSGQPVQPAAADCEALNLYDCVQGLSLLAGGHNLADQLEDAGFGWKGYMDAMPSACFHTDYSPAAAPPAGQRLPADPGHQRPARLALNEGAAPAMCACHAIVAKLPRQRGPRLL
jgi:hypothetical protein